MRSRTINHFNGKGIQPGNETRRQHEVRTAESASGNIRLDSVYIHRSEIIVRIYSSHNLYRGRVKPGQVKRRFIFVCANGIIWRSAKRILIRLR